MLGDLERPPVEPSGRISRLAAISRILQRNQDLLRNAGSLAATTGVTSVLGFAYWIYAARVFPPRAVGYGSAAISTMTLLGTIGMFGIGTMLIGELPRRESRGGLISAALIASFVGSLVLGLGFAIVSLAFGDHFVEIAGTLARMLVFSFGVAITGATLVFDEATIGLMRGGLQLSRNMAVSVIKIIALPASSLVLHDLFGVGIMLSWVLGTFVSLIPVIIIIKRSGGKFIHRPDWPSFKQLGKVTLAHNWLNLAIYTPTKLIPVLVVIVVSPSENAAYYIASMLVSFLYMVPLSLSTVLFAIAAATPELIPEKLRFVIRMSILIGIPGGLALGLSSHYVLSVFGPSYARLATGPLWLLIAGYLPGLPSTLYIDVCRATGRVNQATVFLSVAAVVQMAAVVVGGKVDGLYGLSYGMLAVGIVSALLTTPTVWRTAYGSAPIRSATAPATEGQSQSPAPALDTALRLRQESGLAALMALATAVVPDQEHAHGTAGSPHAAGIPPWAKETRAQPSLSRSEGRHGHRRAPVPVTKADRAVAETSWWSDDELNFRARQESGMAALIAIATHAARF